MWRRQQIGRKGPDDLPLVLRYPPHRFLSCPVGNLVELAPQQGDAGFGIDARGRNILMSEELLHIGNIHAVGGRRPWCGAAGGDDAFADSGAVDDLATI